MRGYQLAMNKLKEKLNNIRSNLSKNKKEKVVKKYLTRVPQTEDRAIKVMKKALVQKENEIVELKSHIKEIEQKKLIKEKDKQIKKEILLSRMIEQALRNQRRIVFKIEDVDKHFKKIGKLPTFLLKSNKIVQQNGKFYPYFWGIELYETDEGNIYWYPLIKSDDNKIVRFKRPSPEFMDMFADPLGLVSQLHSGSIKTNFDFVNGKPVLKMPVYREVETNEKVKVIDLSPQKQKEYEDIIVELREALSKQYSENERLRKMKIAYDNKLAEAEVNTNISKEESKLAMKSLAKLTSPSLRLAEHLLDIITSLPQSKVNQVLLEQQNTNLLELVDNLQSEINSIKKAGSDKYIRGEVLEDIDNTMNYLYKLKSLDNAMAKSTKKPTKEKEK